MVISCVACQNTTTGDTLSKTGKPDFTSYGIPKPIAWFDADDVVAVADPIEYDAMTIQQVYFKNATLARVLEYIKLCKKAGFTYSGLNGSTSEPTEYSNDFLMWDGLYMFNNGDEYAISIVAYRNCRKTDDGTEYNMDILFANRTVNP